MIDFELGPASEAFRAEARAFLEEAMTPELEERIYRTGVSHDDEFRAKLRDRGWLAPGTDLALTEWGAAQRQAIEDQTDLLLALNLP